MTISIISVTEKGRALSGKIAENLGEEFEVKRYCYYKNSDGFSEKFTNISELTASIFRQSSALVFVCSCGIAVRAIAPLLQSKDIDPAVVAADDSGKFVIPILSGHIGGANRLAEIIAKKIGARVVITTATDTGGRFSPDSFAQANRLLITDFEAAKEIAAAVLNDEKIGLHCDYPYKNPPFEIVGISENEYCRTGLCIGANPLVKPFEVTLNLIPRNIVIGIGCRKNTPCKDIENHIFTTLKKEGIFERRVSQVATIDIKGAEPGLVEFCSKYNLPLMSFSAKQLNELEGDFHGSSFVLSQIGTDNVCERSAVRCGGKLILHKRSSDNVTVAAAELPVDIDFERKFQWNYT